MTGAWRVVEADRHRNGIAGEGFTVGIIEQAGRRQLVIHFPETDRAGNLRRHQSRIAVLDLDMAATGNIYMHPHGDHAGGNAWRGDHYQAQAAAVSDAVTERLDALIAAMAEEAE